MGCFYSTHGQDSTRNMQSNLCVHNKMVGASCKYDIEKKLGEGAFGAVHLAKDRATGRLYAVKIIALAKAEKISLRAEVDVWRSLQHPNIVRLLETYEDGTNMYMVMDLCTGAPLFDRLKDRGYGYSEEWTKVVIRKIASALCYLHEKNIVHRDLKLENILTESTDEDAEIKLCDFGASRLVQEGRNMKTVMGTVYYMAPEVLEGNYSLACDLWSLGVIMYMLLCNKAPFFGQTSDEIVDSIFEAKVSFDAEVWSGIGAEAKSLITRLLQVDVNKRYTAKQTLMHPWLKDNEPIVIETGSVASQLKAYCSYATLKRAALLVIAFSLHPEEVKQTREVFAAFDTAKNGTIQLAELQAALQATGQSSEQIKKQFECVDQDRTDGLNFLEFVAATVEPAIFLDHERLKEAFKILDRSNTGKITTDDLRVVMGSDYDESLVGEMMECAAKDKEGEIGFDQFVGMMQDHGHDMH